MKVVILHGLGQTASDWKLVINRLSQEVVTLNLFESIDDDTQLSVEVLSKRIDIELEEVEEPFILVGLSLGGLLALNYAIKNPSDYLKGLIICGAIYKPIPVLIRVIQSIAINFLPQNKLKEIGLTKRQSLDLINSINQVNLTKELTKINLKTLVVCGSKDKLNLKSSKDINYLIKDSRLEIIKNGQHELNKSNPNEIAHLIQGYSNKLECN